MVTKNGVASAVLAASVLAGAQSVAFANPVFGGAARQSLDQTAMARVTGQGATSDYYGYYGYQYAYWAYYYGYNGWAYATNEASNYYNAYANAYAAYQYLYWAYYYANIGQ